MGHEGSGYTTRHLICREFVCLRMCGALWGCNMVAQITVTEWSVCWSGRRTWVYIGGCKSLPCGVTFVCSDHLWLGLILSLLWGLRSPVIVRGLLIFTWMGLGISLLLVAGCRVGLTPPGVLSSVGWVVGQSFSSQRSDMSSSLQNVLAGLTYWMDSARRKVDPRTVSEGEICFLPWVAPSGADMA